ncbi:hypothetical protein ACJIZ3_000824 [Penstemon smallii]|uniref:DYW domain-containing protein n=1 Tax=Penstemon smallii TaxID=265156 RepID=A0ABD3U3L4_9LAMI
MGWDFASLPMPNPTTATIVRGILSTFHRTPERCSTLCPSKKSLLNSLRFRSYPSSAALISTERPSHEFKYEKNPKLFQPPIGSKKPQVLDSVLLIGRLKWYSEKLRYCANDLCLREGKLIHGQIIRTGIEPDLHLWVSLINFYAKCGALKSSRNAFKKMLMKDVVSWTALISGFVARGYGVESVELFCEMRRENVRPNEFTLATVLKGCTMSSNLEFGKQLHTEVVKMGVLSDVYVGSTLVDFYSKCREMKYAKYVFFAMPEKNSVLWNALLNGYAQTGHGEEVLRLFCKMSEPEMRFSNYTLSVVLKGVASYGDVQAGQAIHSMMIKIVGDKLDDFVSCSLVNMYSKCGQANDALKVFEGIKNPDIVAWSSIISVLDHQGQKDEAVKIFHLMRHSGMKPNQFTLTTLVSAATDLDDPRIGQSTHACAHKFGFEVDESVSNALIAMYMKFGFTYDGYQIFNKMTNRDVISWNALLSGFHNDKTSDQGIGIFKKMLIEGFKPNMYTFISTLRCCLDIEFGEQVHSHVIKHNLVFDGYVGTALIDMYAKFGRMDDVEVIFSRLGERDIFTWTVIISGYSQTNQGEKATHFFNQMRREGVVPNEFTLACCLKSSSGIASLENGRQLHSLAVKFGHSSDMFVASALIDMYEKCGHIDHAEALFNNMPFGDTVLWNTIIHGYSQHGQGDKALQAFTTMIDEGVLPDGVTFLGILSACSHMGLVEEGRKHFQSMSELYGISPRVEHYACIVYILGRAGKFDQVQSFISDMELTPNALIWENVLGACSIHGNVELGEIAAKKVFQMEPEMDSNYILLSNLYASRGRWDDVSKVRASMSSKGIKKETGCSWIENDKQMHVFSSQNVSHPRLIDIHQKLEELGERVMEAGYVPNTKYVLHNMTEKEKRENLSHHSERLALGFALISKVKSGKIRIFKNLRICRDCHEFMKFVSGIINQEIVVRDTNQFHHFHHGLCSCKDYW